MTTHIDFFDLFTVNRRDAESSGGTFIELLNPNGDGVVYLPLDRAELVNEIFSNLQPGELK